MPLVLVPEVRIVYYEFYVDFFFEKIIAAQQIQFPS